MEGYGWRRCGESDLIFLVEETEEGRQPVLRGQGVDNRPPSFHLYERGYRTFSLQKNSQHLEIKSLDVVCLEM